ncbi:acetyl-CoA acetyltransferase [Pelagibacteraceae bacterium]|nr:acetyl-CoA acetyltransferase [Pelagibacteraceae bacterium]
MRQPCIVGVADAKIDERGCAEKDSSVLSIQKECATEALESAGLKFNDIDGIAVAGLWGMPGPGVMQPNVLTEYLGISYPKWLDGTNTGGSAFIFHLHHAYQAIRNNVCNNVLILYGSTQKSNKERNFLDRPAVFSSQFDMVAGLPSPVGAYALAAQRHMYKYGSTKETLAEIAVAAREWAKLNPNAYKKESLSISDVLSSKPICSPLGKLDCCLVTDGGGAIVVSNSERKEDFKKKPIFIKGIGETSSHSSINYMEDMARLDVAIKSSNAAYKMASITPNEIDFAMIYDSFTITVLMSLEALGFCNLGEGKDFIKNGNLGPNGSFPINTNGGGLSYCHPGMYSIFTMIEGCRQLWGECGERQLKKNIKNVLCHGTGGVLSSAATTILSKEAE